MQSNTHALQSAAQKSYEAHVDIIPLVVHDTVIYRSAESDAFIHVFEHNPLNKVMVQNLLNTYTPMKYSPIDHTKLLNVNLALN